MNAPDWRAKLMASLLSANPGIEGRQVLVEMHGARVAAMTAANLLMQIIAEEDLNEEKHEYLCELGEITYGHCPAEYRIW